MPKLASVFIFCVQHFVIVQDVSFQGGPWFLEPAVPAPGALKELVLVVSQLRMLVHHLPDDVGDETVAILGIKHPPMRVLVASFHLYPSRTSTPQLFDLSPKAVVAPETVEGRAGHVQMDRVVLNGLLGSEAYRDNMLDAPLVRREPSMTVGINVLIKTKAPLEHIGNSETRHLFVCSLFIL